MHESLSGKWRIAERPALVLSLMGVICVVLVAWVPKEFDLLRVVGLAFGMFACGMLFSPHAAIWEKTNKTDRPSTGEQKGDGES